MIGTKKFIAIALALPVIAGGVIAAIPGRVDGVSVSAGKSVKVKGDGLSWLKIVVNGTNDLPRGVVNPKYYDSIVCEIAAYRMIRAAEDPRNKDVRDTLRFLGIASYAEGSRMHTGEYVQVPDVQKKLKQGAKVESINATHMSIYARYINAMDIVCNLTAAAIESLPGGPDKKLAEAANNLKSDFYEYLTTRALGAYDTTQAHHASNERQFADNGPRTLSSIFGHIPGNKFLLDGLISRQFDLQFGEWECYFSEHIKPVKRTELGTLVPTAEFENMRKTIDQRHKLVPGAVNDLLSYMSKKGMDIAIPAITSYIKPENSGPTIPSPFGDDVADKMIEKHGHPTKQKRTGH